MKKPTPGLPEILYLLCLFLFLFASDLAHFEHGSELSLWLMAFAVVLATTIRVFPWLGIRWLKIEPAGNRTGRWLATFFQVGSWTAYALAMALRWRRNLVPFHWWITLAALLWVLSMLIFIYNRYALDAGDTLKKDDSDSQSPN